MITPAEFHSLPGPSEDNEALERHVDSWIRESRRNGCQPRVPIVGYSPRCVSAVLTRYHVNGWHAEIVHGSEGSYLALRVT